MSEERVPYLDTTTTAWADVRFADGKHTGVRVLRGTTVIEVQRAGRKLLFNTADCLPIDLIDISEYNG
jgi:hypothetical protein